MDITDMEVKAMVTGMAMVMEYRRIKMTMDILKGVIKRRDGFNGMYPGPKGSREKEKSNGQLAKNNRQRAIGNNQMQKSKKSNIKLAALGL